MSKTTIGLIGLISLISLPIYAELQVIADLGGESAVRFYEPIQPIIDESSSVPGIPSELNEADLLPIVSHMMSPGSVSSRELSLPGMSPIFLVGDDELSRRWLAHHRDRLTQMQATGLVVQVNDIDGLARLRQVAGEQLTLLPVSADDLAQRLQLNHYPVLLSDKGLSQ